jgi:Ca2+/H+ antiporter
MIRVLLLLLLPIAPILDYGLGLSPLWVFISGVGAIGVTAKWIRVATEQLAMHTGPTVGGLMTVSLGSVAELLPALFVLANGEIEVVHAQITGSIMAASLLGLGLSVVVGGATRSPSPRRGPGRARPAASGHRSGSGGQSGLAEISSASRSGLGRRLRNSNCPARR